MVFVHIDDKKIALHSAGAAGRDGVGVCGERSNPLIKLTAVGKFKKRPL